MAREVMDRKRSIAAKRTKRLTGAQVLMEALTREGVELIFGHPGGASLPIYDALYDAKTIHHILVRHEQVAAHAAVGYARASGRVGVCTATSGPGATNLVTGLTDAMMDSIPIVAITGQVPRSVIGNDAFQEADVTGITMPITKHNMLVMHAADIPRAIQQAFYLAKSGRPGPVLVDIPRDVSQELCEPIFPDEVSIPGYHPVLDGNANRIAAAADALANAERPVIFAGGGIIASTASEELTALVERTGVPTVLSLMGKGAMDETHPKCLGMLGMHGSAFANWAINEADVILAVGVRFDDRVTGRIAAFAPRARFIHIDIDPAEIGKNKPAHIPIVGDAKRVLTELLTQVRAPKITAWWQTIDQWRAQHPFHYRQQEGRISAQFVCELINQLTEGQAIVTTDVGQRPDRQVVAVVGDGGFQMTLQDLITAVEHELSLPIIVLNNSALGMVRQWQTFFYKGRLSASVLRNPDFAKLAEAFGARGIRVDRAADVEPALRTALSTEGVPCVVDVICDPDENCLPMIPSGQSVSEMILDE